MRIKENRAIKAELFAPLAELFALGRKYPLHRRNRQSVLRLYGTAPRAGEGRSGKMYYCLTSSSVGWGFRLWVGRADNGWHGYYDTRETAILAAMRMVAAFEGIPFANA